MLSPAKAITAAALAVAIGGVSLIAQPFDEPHQGVPGAATDTDPAWVTGSIAWNPPCSDVGPLTTEDGVSRQSGTCRGQTWTADDPRLSGSADESWSQAIYTPTSEEDLAVLAQDHRAEQVSVFANTTHVENADGAWDCRGVNLGLARGGSSEGGEDIRICEGAGDYQGLSAIIEVDLTGSSPVDFVGLVFAGNVPPLPDPSASK